MLHNYYPWLSCKLISLAFFLFFNNLFLEAQEGNASILSMDKAVTLTLANNPTAKNAALSVNMFSENEQTGILSDPLHVSYSYGNSTASLSSRYLGIQQNIMFPLRTMAQTNYNKKLTKVSRAEQSLTTNKLISETKAAYTCWLYDYVKQRLLSQTADLINLFLDSTGLPVTKADTSVLERLSLETEYAGIQNLHFQATQELRISENKLAQMIFTKEHFIPVDTSLEIYALQSARSGTDKFLPSKTIQYYNELTDLNRSVEVLERSKLFPELEIGYFNWEVTHYYHFQGIHLGMSIPLWYPTQRRKIRESIINTDISRNESDNQEYITGLTIENLKLQLDQLFVFISYYRENGLKLAELQEKLAVNSISHEKVTYLEFLKQISQSLHVKLEYLDKVKQYNLSAIQLEYYIN